ncbi:hypothetical protein OPQ81_010679 [Rhizoctonia solani]|nr:hypothetical protein OPQ81_010679 [Rhizoctonia solani]
MAAANHFIVQPIPQAVVADGTPPVALGNATAGLAAAVPADVPHGGYVNHPQIVMVHNHLVTHIIPGPLGTAVPGTVPNPSASPLHLFILPDLGFA